ncbi:MAG: lamin tail domain-containing protein [Verrucomicrobiales bacterium]
MQRPFPPLAVALALCAFAASSPEARADLRITEIMFQAAPIDGREPVEREFIEITNTGVEAVNLDGYELDRGVDYTFGSVQIPAQGRLVVASDVAAFQSVYPGVTNVVGPWTGNLSNSGEEIRLVDFNGDTADRVEYFDQGDWAVRRRGPNDGGHRGWVWENLADGGGRSLELITLSLSNNAGQNWAPSAADGGTPGAANSVAAANIAPLIRDAGHSPAVPTSADPIYFTARIEDEEAGAAVALFWRSHSNTSPGSFVALPMADDGQSGDGAAGDGVFGTSIPPQPNGLVIEFYFRAGDVGGRSRTWPGPTDESGTQGANCLLQVDNENYAGGQPIYRMILSGTERDEFFNGFNAGSDAQMNATFIASYGGQTALRYVGGTRRRGAGSRGRSPVGVRLNLARDRPFNGDSRLNLNTQYTYSQVVGHLLHGAAGLEGADGTAVQVRWNGENQAVNGSLMYGSYAHMEPLSGEWVDDHLPEDNGGTLYKKIRPDNSWAYRNGNISAYRSDGWIQQTNEGDGDSSWDGLDNLMRAMNSDAGSPTYLSDVAEVADLDQWMRWFGVMALLANGETNASNGADDDYAMYESGVDGRFIFIAHDLDTILSNGDGSRITDPEHTIFDMIERGDVLEPLVPLFQRPEIIRLYYQTLRDLIDGPFSKPEFDELVQNHLGGWVDQDEIDSIIDYMDARRTYVDGIVSGSYSAGTDLSASQGYPRTTDGGLTLSGTTDISGVGSVTVNGEPAALTFARGGGTWSLAIGGLTGDTQILSPRKSNWKYLDNGSDQGTAWRQPGFNDSGWQQGDAELGYGDEARQTTIASYGPNAGNKYLTTYFRRTFTIAIPRLRLAPGAGAV